MTATSVGALAGLLRPGDPEWRDRALCRAAKDPDLFFPGTGGGPNGEAVRNARAWCNRCSVWAACLDDAMHQEGSRGPGYRYGIRGGLTAKERADEYKRRKRTAQASSATGGGR
ncbi:WhiB family transcriptional regulator [Kitasatospora sp. NPDC059571]|uniref:WhiB family transcriptional regulator n=1 Tax=Kitasatospora sp. NPDC059571 TaxID=3346871 RepID=UPI003695530F